MRRTVSARAARQRLGALLDGVQRDGDEVIVERDGKPVAVVVPIERYAMIEDAPADAWARLWKEVDAIHRQNRDLDPDEVERIVNDEVETVRAPQRGTGAAGASVDRHAE